MKYEYKQTQNVHKYFIIKYCSAFWHLQEQFDFKVTSESTDAESQSEKPINPFSWMGKKNPPRFSFYLKSSFWVLFPASNQGLKGYSFKLQNIYIHMM